MAEPTRQASSEPADDDASVDGAMTIDEVMRMGTDAGGMREFVLLYEASSLTDYGKMADPQSVEAHLARGRGDGAIVGGTEADDSRPTESPESYELGFEQGRLKVDSGYAMRFVPPEFRTLSVWDICSVPDLRSFPAPVSAVESLSRGLQTALEEQGYLCISAEYNQGDQTFSSVRRGWKIDPNNPLDILMIVTQELDGRTAPAHSYVFHYFGGERWADPGVIADARGIEEQTVRNQIEEAEEALESLGVGSIQS